MASMRWLPLESNPEVMNKYVHALGVPTDVEFHDIWGLDAELLQMVPKPVKAVLLLFPISDKVDASPIGTEQPDSNLYFIKQTIGNACGTIGIIHSLANNASALNLSADKTLAKFLQATKSMSPVEKAKALEDDTSFQAAHESSALEGQTAAPDRNEKVNLHFVAFVHHEGGLYELDGRRGSPVHHGNTTPDTLLEDTASVVKKFMERDPENLNFTLVALAKK